jgi:HPt (histidine-containing phosphotransfer) domain-containing protein
VLKLFTDNHQRTVSDIQAALRDGRQPEAVRLAHTLRGTAVSIGARELAERPAASRWRSRRRHRWRRRIAS